MMNRFLKNKKGVTILEGLIALGLLALVAGGTFGVLLSVSRKASNPDIREEMILAVERANEQLQMYTDSGVNESDVPEAFKKGLCGESSSFSAVLVGRHNISCMLPAICDKGNSHFYYTVGSSVATTVPSDDKLANSHTKTIDFEITCNGFTL